MKPATMKSAIVIPARMNSTRLARKMLLAETGKPLLQHTYESASKATKASEVIVAVDCEELAAAVREFGGRVVLTDPACASGTDRVAEVARKLPFVDIVVNVQGDEPEIVAGHIDLVIELLEHDQASMSTIAAPIRDKHKLNDPACVKVVRDDRGRAMYFSRAPIPFARTWDDLLLAADPPVFLQHIGVYGYRRERLLEIAGLPQSSIEQVECLEQLRVLQAGISISVGLVDRATIGIDTSEDYREFVERHRQRQGAFA